MSRLGPNMTFIASSVCVADAPRPERQFWVQERMVQFAMAAVPGRSEVPGDRKWADMKELVATSSDTWEPSTKLMVQ